MVALAFKRLRVTANGSTTAVQVCLANAIAEHHFESQVKADPFWAVGQAIYTDGSEA